MNRSRLRDDEDNEDEFTPAPARTPKQRSRRRTTNTVSQTPRTAKRTMRPTTGESIDHSEGDYVEEASHLGSPTKRTSPRKRAPPKPRSSAIPGIAPPTFASQIPLASDQSRLSALPLGDISDATLNGKLPVAKTEERAMSDKSSLTLLEKPMDIVIRSRAMPATTPEQPSGPTSRIVLTYLILTNFKSYAGRQEVGPFHSSFSSVVGPNGSGKSNVIDSLLFVFGFRASKMRQGKISALIHNSAAFPNLVFCEVEVHFREVRDLVGV